MLLLLAVKLEIAHDPSLLRVAFGFSNILSSSYNAPWLIISKVWESYPVTKFPRVLKAPTAMEIDGWLSNYITLLTMPV